MFSLGIAVKPNPVRVGGSVEVSGDPGATVKVGFKGTISDVVLDEKGKATVKAPGEAGDAFTVSDGKFPRANAVRVRVVSTIK